MGSLARQPLSDLVRQLRHHHSLDTLVETGTAEGESTLFGSDEFARVFSIEKHPMLLRAARERCSNRNNVTLLLGDSRNRLNDVVRYLSGPALFWLDAHTDEDTPILEELEFINRSPHRHVVMIDDAHQVHYILHWRKSETREGAAWPSIPKIAEKASEGGYVMEITEHDVIVLVPALNAQ